MVYLVVSEAVGGDDDQLVAAFDRRRHADGVADAVEHVASDPAADVEHVAVLVAPQFDARGVARRRRRVSAVVPDSEARLVHTRTVVRREYINHAPCGGGIATRLAPEVCGMHDQQSSAQRDRLGDPSDEWRAYQGAPTGTDIECEGWRQEAALRMLNNNLDPEVAERPEDLVVYGGTGRAARSWDAYDAILAELRDLDDDETLLVQSGKPVGKFPTHERAPRVLIANSNLVGRWDDWEHFHELEAEGKIMYGQMTAGSWAYIGTQGIIQGTFETLAELARQHYDADLRGKLVVTGGLGGMSGAQPLAVTMNHGVCIAAEVQADRIERRVETDYLMEFADSLDEALENAQAAVDAGEPYSVGVQMNAADMLEELLALNHLLKERGAEGILDGKVLIGCMNRGGLNDTEFEMRAGYTAYTAERLAQMRMDGGKMWYRLNPESEAAGRSVRETAKQISALNDHDLPAFLEPLSTREVDGEYEILTDKKTLIRDLGVGAALGDSSRNLWLKLPYTENFERIAKATTCPILLLGGAAGDDSEGTVREMAEGFESAHNVRGAMIGRRVSFPGEGEDPLAVADAIGKAAHADYTADEAVDHLDAVRGERMDFLSQHV